MTLPGFVPKIPVAGHRKHDDLCEEIKGKSLKIKRR